MPARSEDCNDAPAPRRAADRGECAALELAMGQARESLASLTLRGTTRLARTKKCDGLTSEIECEIGRPRRRRAHPQIRQRTEAGVRARQRHCRVRREHRDHPHPAAFPAATPGGESSTTTQSLGATPRRPAAIRYPSGYGLPCFTSPAVTNTSGIGSPAVRRRSVATARLPDVTMA